MVLKNIMLQISNFIMHLRNVSNHPLLVRNQYTDEILWDIARRGKAFEPVFGQSDLGLMVEDMSVMSDFELDRFCQRYTALQSFTLGPQCLLQSAKCLVRLSAAFIVGQQPA
jgi:SWI/SNF-related matrix-associated actin-dependent regulator 1 of chromatin subfamily A